MSWFTSVLSPRDSEIMARERELDSYLIPLRFRTEEEARTLTKKEAERLRLVRLAAEREGGVQ